MSFTPSKYQQAIYDFIKEGTGNAIIEAVAGSGKSTTIVNALKIIPQDQSVLFLAFNKAIVEELKIKIGDLPNVEVKTLHSLGASAIMNQIRTSIQADKYRMWVNSGLKYGNIKPLMDLGYEDLSEYKANIMKLIDLIRVNLCDLRSDSDIFDLMDKHNMDILDNELDIAKKAIKWGLREIGSIDFTDMIYFPNVLDIRMPQYDFVLIDECQDLNAAQREMFLKCVKPQGRFIAVGDPKQAIYGFAGADVESFNRLKSLPNTTLFPLSVCYRCSSEIINLAKTIVPQIEPREGTTQGQVDYLASVADVKDGDMILCRVTAPLANLCMKYIGSGVKAYIKGKDIGLNLINMINKTRRTNITDALKVMDRELDKIAKRVSSKQKCTLSEAKQSNQYLTYLDKIKAIEALSEGITQTKQLISRIESIFKEENKAGICLSTIHKAKGLEADRVFIACPDKLYNKRSMQIPWMREQEINLVYVAYTRAKYYLGFITDYDY